MNEALNILKITSECLLIATSSITLLFVILSFCSNKFRDFITKHYNIFDIFVAILIIFLVLSFIGKAVTDTYTEKNNDTQTQHEHIEEREFSYCPYCGSSLTEGNGTK